MSQSTRVLSSDPWSGPMAAPRELAEWITVGELDPKEIRKAQLTVCALAHDAADAELLLDALGIREAP